MKQVKYFCDICGKEIPNPKEELNCIAIDMKYVHDWTIDLPIARDIGDRRVCKVCGEKVNSFIINLINERGQQ